MPFLRPTLSDLIAMVAADIAASLPGADPLLRFSSLKITGKTQAGFSHLHYGYLDVIAKESVPFTSTGENLTAWGAMRNVFQKDATPAKLTVSFPGTNGVPLDAGTSVTRGDGAEYLTDATATVVGTTVTASVTAVVPGSAGNSDPGVVMTLGTSVPGIQSTGSVTAVVSSGTDIEDVDDFRDRVIAAYQHTPQGGDQDDYVGWATDVPAVTRAWVKRNGAGTGTVVVYVMLDTVNSAHGGFPQGTDGVASNEPRAAPATGDQLVVANAIFPLQPVTALVYAVSPVPNPIAFTISGLTEASTALRAQIANSITDVFFRLGDPTGSTVTLSAIEVAIGALAGTDGFVIESPDTNIVSAAGYLPTLGTVTYP